MGQMVFFAAYLETTGLFDTWVEESPLHYTRPNAPQKRGVLGTLFLYILAGHRRYAHVTALRSDGVSPNILGMRKIVSEDALRRALGKIPEADGTEWMRKHLFKSMVAACQTPLDSGYRYVRQAPVRASGRRGSGLQSAQARTTVPAWGQWSRP
ncbi:hypothetical protein RIE95_07295 [Acidithiobacillus thiooxidans]|uniref:hypothetical protein n=1 Tax=Acidithiobacillus thiooxidans TaxID=930 RepID=UPI00285A9465|nr:hypothetical protein [Acidithiobacillus thiooxidans]MDR7926788.1 hypothetical protein [Acidithiobacillus thiooxidans]